MTRTVGELRNDIRVAVGRFERPESAAFTKESLQAIYEAVGADDGGGGRPSTGAMRAGILAAIGYADPDEADDDRGPFRKAELVAIADAVDAN